MRRPAVLVPLVLVTACAAGAPMVRWEDAEPAPSPVRIVDAPVAEPARAPTSAAAPAPMPAAAPAAPVARTAALVVNGATVDDGALVELPALELACLADARALIEPGRVAARVTEQGAKGGVALGPFSFVVLERDPARSLVEPPPRFCRPLQGGAPLVAPLLHHREPAGRWLVRRARSGVVADTAAIVEECRARGLTPSGRPRVLVDEVGALVALALPVGTEEH